jgi:hypothetical protein
LVDPEVTIYKVNVMRQHSSMGDNMQNSAIQGFLLLESTMFHTPIAIYTARSPGKQQGDILVY